MATALAFESLTTYEAVQAAQCDCTDIDEAAIDILIDLASDLLVMISGRELGRGSVTVRPCSDACSCGATGCDMCVCCHLDAIVLPGENPAVTQVKIDGDVLAAANYKIMDGNRLVRVATTDRPPSWPGTQYLWRPDTEPGTWSIAVTRGITNNQIIEDAAIAIVCWLLKTWPEKRTTYDPRASSVTQGGVTLTLDNLADRLKKGDMALPKVITFMSIYGRDGMVPASVWSPELAGGYALHTFS